MSGTITFAGQAMAEMARIYRDTSDLDPPWKIDLVDDLSVGSQPSEIGLLDRLPVGVAIYDRDGELVHANPRFLKSVPSASLSLGSRDEALRWFGWTASGDALAARDFPCERALRGHTVSPGVDLLYHEADGSRRWLNVSAAPICEPGQDLVLGIIVVVMDKAGTPESRHSEASSDALFRQFAEQSSSAIWIVDAATRRYRYRNPEHRRLISVDPDHASSAGLADWIAHIDIADRASVEGRYEAVLAGASEQHEYRLQGASGGGALHLRETVFAIKSEDGKIKSLCGIADRIAPTPELPIFLVGGNVGRPCPTTQQLRQIAGPLTERFNSIASFLEASSRLTTGCVVIDMNQVPDTGEVLVRMIADHADRLPIIVIGRPDTDAATAISAMRAGALDYLLAPCSAADLERALDCARTRLQAQRHDPTPATSSCKRVDGLSHREVEVLAGLRAGGTNKSIGRDLGISPRTVESHRSRLMERMNARNLAELLQAVQ